LSSFFTLSYFFFLFYICSQTSAVYTLSLHDALPIFRGLDSIFTFLLYLLKWLTRHLWHIAHHLGCHRRIRHLLHHLTHIHELLRSEEHTSELQSRENLVCRLLLEKKNKSKWQ